MTAVSNPLMAVFLFQKVKVICMCILKINFLSYFCTPFLEEYKFY